MKKAILGLMLVSASLFGKTYLGGAYSLSHCSQLAGSYGYNFAQYGPGYDDRGAYYPYVNACFGSYESTIPGLGTNRYHVTIRSGESLRLCAEDIQFEVSGVRCRISGPNLTCISDSGPRQRQIERVRCVDRAYPHLGVEQ